MRIRLVTIAIALYLQAGLAQSRRDPFQPPGQSNPSPTAGQANQTQVMPANQTQAVPANPPSVGDASPPMSLAERAAAIRKTRQTRQSPASPLLTPEQRGAIQEGKYSNAFFHFEITQPHQWTFYGAGQMNASEAVGRAALNLPSGLSGSPSRVWGMGGGAGRNVMMSIVPMPADAPADLNQLAAALKKFTFSQLPSAQGSEEKVLLGDAAHTFAAFRYAFSVNGVPLVQSVQLARANGFLIVLTTTARSDEDVSDALRTLSANFSWKTN